MITIEKLRSQIKGRVIEPRDVDYDEVHKVFVGGVERRPAHIVRAADPVDIACAIAFAREARLELAARNKSVPAQSEHPTIGGMLILNSLGWFFH